MDLKNGEADLRARWIIQANRAFANAR